MRTPDEIARTLGISWFDYQLEAFETYLAQANRRVCLFFRTGAGKTLTALGCLSLEGFKQALVIAPPRIHSQWLRVGESLGMELTMVSHQKFYRKNFEVPHLPIVVDEFHLLGGIKGLGWKKLRANTDKRRDPIIIMSATPFWNGAERVFCAERIVRGYGTYRTFLYQECLLEEDRFSVLPKVVGFKDYPKLPVTYAAAKWMEDQEWTSYLPDTRDIDIHEVEYPGFSPPLLDSHGLSVRDGRIMASLMEEKHVRTRANLMTADGTMRAEVMEQITKLLDKDHGPTLLYCNSSRIAGALAKSLRESGENVELLTGAAPGSKADAIIEMFRTGHLRLLVGTATMRTGTDGFDKACDTLILVDDTEDDAAREQLIGRILPRGVEAPIDSKRVWRLVAT